MTDGELDAVPPSSAAEIERLVALVERWASAQTEENPAVVSVERDVGPEPRWLVRLRGDAKPVFAVWFWLRQRTLHVETYVMPAPVERAAEVYEFVLRQNHRFHAMAFTIGPEDALYLTAQVPHRLVDDAELDRLLGSAYAYTEATFPPAMRIGFGDRFSG